MKIERININCDSHPLHVFYYENVIIFHVNVSVAAPLNQEQGGKSTFQHL